MSFSEFKKLLGADPRSREPETRQARQSGERFESAAQEAEAFERKLEHALRVPVDESLLEQLLVLPRRPERRSVPRWMAMAASVVLVVGVTGIAWWQSSQPDTLEEYVARHHAHDGETLLGRAGEGIDPDTLQNIMASFDVATKAALAERVRFVKYCPTMDGRGAHMIVDSAYGPVQVIYMPGTRVSEAADFRFDGMQAHFLGLEQGSAVVIGRPEQPVGSFDGLLRESIVQLSGGA